MAKDKKEPVRFNLYSLNFKPYKEYSGALTNTSIIKQVLNAAFNLGEKKSHLVDKHAGNENKEARELFLTSVVFMHKERRVRCSMALLRAGRKPKLKKQNKFELIPLSELGEVAEETHFYIDFSKDYCIVCVEYNYHGPRMSDVEFYIRNVARDVLRLARATEITMYMDNSIDKTLSSLRNVLNIDIKMQPKKLEQLDKEIQNKYFSGMGQISKNLNPNFLKIEAMFQVPGKSVKSAELHDEANGMIRELLSVFKEKPLNIDSFDNFVVKFEDKEGNEEVLNLLHGKKEFIKYVDLSTITKKKHLYRLIETDLNVFVDSI